MTDNIRRTNTGVVRGQVVRRAGYDDPWRTVAKVKYSSRTSVTVTFTDGSNVSVGSGTPWEVKVPQ